MRHLPKYPFPGTYTGWVREPTFLICPLSINRFNTRKAVDRVNPHRSSSFCLDNTASLLK